MSVYLPFFSQYFFSFQVIFICILSLGFGCSSRPTSNPSPVSAPVPKLDPVLTRPDPTPIPLDSLSLDLEDDLDYYYVV